MDSDKGVTINDINIPFGRLVMIFIKFALAAIPAYFVVFLIIVLTMGLFGLVFGGMSMMSGDFGR